MFVVSVMRREPSIRCCNKTEDEHLSPTNCQTGAMFVTRPQGYQEARKLKGSVILVEGGIAYGKTTIGKSLASYLQHLGLKAKFFPEYRNPVLLQQYIKNMKKYAYAFQLFLLGRRAETYREAKVFAEAGGIAIVDRSFPGDKAFALLQVELGNMSQNDYATYLAVAKQEIDLEPDFTLRLVCTLETVLERIRQRGHQEEIDGYTPEYLRLLEVQYDKVFTELTAERGEHRILQLPWDQPKQRDPVTGMLRDTDLHQIITAMNG